MNRSRVVVSHSMQINATSDDVFPLLCPVREYEWIDSWQCEMIHSSSGKAEANAVFRTNFVADGPTDTWVISRYEPPRVIEFVRINPLRAISYAIHLEREEAGCSRWRWTQTLTGLNDAGDAVITAMDAAAFAQKIEALEAKLKHFLATGRMLGDNASSSNVAVR